MTKETICSLEKTVCVHRFVSDQEYSFRFVSLTLIDHSKRLMQILTLVKPLSRGYIIIYGGPQVQYSSDMHIAALPSCFSSQLSTFRLFQALFGYAERFFCYAKHFSSYRPTESFFGLPTITRPSTAGRVPCPHTHM